MSRTKLAMCTQNAVDLFFFFFSFKNHIVILNCWGRSSCLFLKVQLLKPMERACGRCKTSLGKMQTTLPLCAWQKVCKFMSVSVLRVCLILSLHFSLLRAGESYLNGSCFRLSFIGLDLALLELKMVGKVEFCPHVSSFSASALVSHFLTSDLKRREGKFSN